MLFNPVSHTPLLINNEGIVNPFIISDSTIGSTHASKPITASILSSFKATATSAPPPVE